MRVAERACAFFDAEILILKSLRALCVRKSRKRIKIVLKNRL